MESAARHLVFHAAIVLLLGLAYGAPYAKAIKSGATEQVVNSWRVAHLSVPIGATLMLAIAAVLGPLAVTPGIKWTIAVLLIVSGYAFSISTPLAAITRDRGLQPGGKGLARLVYLGNFVGAWTSLLAALVFLYAAFVSL